jgi:glycerol-3-phosphate dehydrogenase (NAD(P)+)
VGDLIVTCFSSHSRNHRVGKMLGEGMSLAAAQESLHMVAEGVPNTESIYFTARRHAIRTPIIDQVYAILYQGKPPLQALSELLNRDPRREND